MKLLLYLNLSGLWKKIIKNKNNKIKYEYIEEKSENIEHNNKNNVNNAINDLISIVGNDIIDFK